MRRFFRSLRFFPICLLATVFFVCPPYASAQEGVLDFEVLINAPEKSRTVRLWLPVPHSDDYQTIGGMKIEGNYTRSAVSRLKTGDLVLYAEWKKPARERRLRLSFKASSSERVRKDFPENEPSVPSGARKYLEGSKYIPTDGKVRELAVTAADGKKSVRERARAVYGWVVENTFRDPSIKGCGTGDVERIIAQRGGKCADISSVFVAMARAAGVPSREVFGIRLGKKAEEDVTEGYHCWAEFYLPGYGWVPVDPADVRKAMLTKGLELENAGEYVDYYFGAVDEYRIVLSKIGRGVTLTPAQKIPALNYFMYPYAEVDGKALEHLSRKDLVYKVVFRKAEQPL